MITPARQALEATACSRALLGCVSRRDFGRYNRTVAELIVRHIETSQVQVTDFARQEQRAEPQATHARAPYQSLPRTGEPEERAFPSQFPPAGTSTSRSKLLILSFLVAKDVRFAVTAGGKPPRSTPACGRLERLPSGRDHARGSTSLKQTRRKAGEPRSPPHFPSSHRSTHSPPIIHCAPIARVSGLTIQLVHMATMDGLRRFDTMTGASQQL